MDQKIATDLKNALERRRKGIKVVMTSDIELGENQIESWNNMLLSVTKIVVIVSESLKYENLIKVFFPEVLDKNIGVIPVYLTQNIKDNLPSPLNLIRHKLPVTDNVYDNDCDKWAYLVDDENYKQFMYAKRYIREYYKMDNFIKKFRNYPCEF